MDQQLIIKYRPKTFEEVLGNPLVVQALRKAIESPSRPHTFLLTGPSGTGKTSIARIIASAVDACIEEIDAASNSGIDAMRSLVELSKFQPISGSSCKMVIIDECHGLSKQAWQPLLKLLEEPPAHLYIALATTESTKVPETIRTRSYRIDLKPLKIQEIEDLVAVVAELEGWALTTEVFTGIVVAATGQPRKALTILQSGHTAQTKDELASIVAEVEKDSSPLTELLRFLLSGGKDWGRISALLSKLEDDEEIHTQACRYMMNAMLGGTEEGAKRAWRFLDAFTFPRNSFDRKANLIAAVGAILWG